MSGPPRQQIRPSVEELRRLPPEYDISDEEEEEDDVVPTYAPAASTSRSLPPMIETVNSTGVKPILKSSTNNNVKEVKSVRIAANSNSNSAGGDGSTSINEGRHQRFVIPFDDEDNEEAKESGKLKEDSIDEVSKVMPSLAPVMGTIQERKPIEKARNSSSSSKTERAGTSRFAARRQLDRDAGIAKPVQQGYPVAKRISTVSDENDEIWLDEDSNPMSAFRKSRLMKQGLRPPNVKVMEKVSGGTATPVVLTEEDNSSSISALMRSISAENDAKIAAMSADEVEHDLQDIRETFGSNLLEMLKNRHKSNSTLDSPTKTSSHVRNPKDAKQPPILSRREATSIQGTPAYIRQKYFPNEPEALPSSLNWTQDLPISKEKDSGGHRFDFSGRVINSHADESVTHLEGLHHHGQDQEKPGYTIKELLHLARSTLSSQRVLALQTLGRVATIYPEVAIAQLEDEENPKDAMSKDVMMNNLRGQSCIIASWYIEDRQLNVRSAALACIKACLSSTLVGPNPPFLVEIPSLKSAVQSQKHRDEVSIQESEMEEKPKLPSIHDFELLNGLAVPILRSLGSRDISANEILASLQILLHMSKRSRQVCKTICQDSRVFSDAINKHLLTQAWTEDYNKAEASLLILELMLCLVASSRESAIALKGLTSNLIRFIAVPPWSAPNSIQPHSYRHMNLALQIFAMLARYGIGADTYSSSHSAFIELEQWIRNVEADSASSPLRSIQLETLQSALYLLSNWTICASDAHQTHNHHDITWSQVSEWGDIGAAVLRNLQGSTNEPGEIELIKVQGEAFHLIQVWQLGAKVNRPEELLTLKLEKQFVDEQIKDFLLNVMENIKYYLCILLSGFEDTGEKPLWLSQMPHLVKIAELCKAARAMIGIDEQSGHISSTVGSIVQQLLYEIPWQRLQDVTAIQAGSNGPQRYMTEFIYEALISMKGDEVKAENWLRLLLSLPSGLEEIARDIFVNHLPTQIAQEGSIEISVLSPFLKELVRQTNNEESVAPLWPTISSLQKSNTLFVICQSSSQHQEEETDPLSGASLWKCSNSGLPLRKDWPLVALDDLLHSGNCAALNRPNALSNEWDANELQIVQSSLSLSIRLWQKILDLKDNFILPTSSEIQLSIMKVFMLEEEQQHTGNIRATGKITGRDIYRDEKVSKLLSQHFDLANKIAMIEKGENQQDDLERVCQRQYGTSLPFYQFYTSLVGLYDGISFGMELFGRAIMIPLQMHYPVEYRRLVWVDYAHYLSTIVTKQEDAPNELESYICESEKDDSIIRGMALALLSGNIQSKRNDLLFAISTQQLARLIWSKYDQEREKQRVERLIKTLFHERDLENPTSDIPHIQIMRNTILDWTAKSSSLNSNILSREERIRMIEQR